MLKLSLAMSSLAVAVLVGCGSDSGRSVVDSATPDGAGGADGNTADAPLTLDGDRATDLPAPDVRLSGTGGSSGIDAFALVDASTGGAGGGVAGSGGSVGGDVSSADGGGRDGGGADRASDSPATGGAQGGGPGSGGVGAGGTGGTLHGGADGRLDGGDVGGMGGATCIGIITEAAHLPADVLLVLDRSASMSYSVADDCYCPQSSTGTPLCPDSVGCTSRWSALAAAVDATLSSTPAINWGLKLFASPGGSICTVSTGVEVPISSSSASVIASQIAKLTLGNNTPTAAAIAKATTYLTTVTDGNGKVILLATDGQPNCAGGASSSSPDVMGTVAAIEAARSAGFPVYVVGIGPSVGNLDNFAQAGGTAHYFPATSPEALVDAFRSVSTATTTCTFTLATLPPDPNNVGIYLDKSLVPRDGSNGWSFGPTPQTIVLAGRFCDLVTSGAASHVQALFGCPGVPLPPVLP